MSKLKCERRSGYLVCYPHRRRVKRIVGRALAALGAVVFLLLLVYLYVGNPETLRLPVAQKVPEAENDASKLQAVKYLNRIRGEQGIPPVQLIDFNVAEARAKYLSRTNLFSHYDAEGRHPGYWYTQLDGGLYGVEENLMMRYVKANWLPMSIAEANYTDAIHNLVFNDVFSGWGHRDSLLDPCNNYVAMGTSYFWNGTYGARYYVVYMVAKWVEWVSPPRYEGGRFTAEGYAAPVMKPKFFAVYYAKYESNPASRHSYDVGDLYFCKVLDEPFAKCKDAQEPAGAFTVEKMQDGKWHIKIDMPAALDRPGLYTFMIVAEDLRGLKWSPLSLWGHARVGKCRIMEYTVAK
ncbi:MAG: hypothetical protein GU356_01145 [Pyrobaculum sp.]|nr:hypothetical protein [Pyrobaculum sp.]